MCRTSGIGSLLWTLSKWNYHFLWCHLDLTPPLPHAYTRLARLRSPLDSDSGVFEWWDLQTLSRHSWVLTDWFTDWVNLEFGQQDLICVEQLKTSKESGEWDKAKQTHLGEEKTQDPQTQFAAQEMEFIVNHERLEITGILSSKF